MGRGASLLDLTPWLPRFGVHFTTVGRIVRGGV